MVSRRNQGNSYKAIVPKDPKEGQIRETQARVKKSAQKSDLKPDHGLAQQTDQIHPDQKIRKRVPCPLSQNQLQAVKQEGNLFLDGLDQFNSDLDIYEEESTIWTTSQSDQKKQDTQGLKKKQQAQIDDSYWKNEYNSNEPANQAQNNKSKYFKESQIQKDDRNYSEDYQDNDQEDTEDTSSVKKRSYNRKTDKKITSQQWFGQESQIFKIFLAFNIPMLNKIFPEENQDGSKQKIKKGTISSKSDLLETDQANQNSDEINQSKKKTQAALTNLSAVLEKYYDSLNLQSRQIDLMRTKINKDDIRKSLFSELRKKENKILTSGRSDSWQIPTREQTIRLRQILYHENIFKSSDQELTHYVPSKDFMDKDWVKSYQERDQPTKEIMKRMIKLENKLFRCMRKGKFQNGKECNIRETYGLFQMASNLSAMSLFVQEDFNKRFQSFLLQKRYLDQYGDTFWVSKAQQETQQEAQKEVGSLISQADNEQMIQESEK